MTGLDASPTLVSAAAEADPASRYVVGPAEALPFDDGAFDLVVAYNSLMDVDDMPVAVREAARVLAPGGRLCACITHPVQTASTWDHEDDDAPLVVSEAYLDRRWMDVAVEREGLAFTFDGWCYPLEAYTRALEEAGLLIEALREPGDPDRRALVAGADVPRVARGQGALGAAAHRVGDPHVHVVVVVDQRDDDRPRPAKVQVRPDEQPHGAGPAEAVHQVLGQGAVDLRRAPGRQRRAVAARVHDVGVEAVLVRAVAEPAVAGTERPALRTAEIGDQDGRHVGVRFAELARHRVEQDDERIGAPAPRVAVGRHAQDRIPGDEVGPRLGQLDAVLEATVPGHADGDRPRRIGLRGLGSDRIGLGRRGLRLRRRPASAIPATSATAPARKRATIAGMGHRLRAPAGGGDGAAVLDEHVAALGAMAFAAALAIATARRGGARAVALLTPALALVILAGWIGEQIADLVEGIWSVKYTLPLQLTDVVSVVAVAALLRPRPLLVELTWFWARPRPSRPPSRPTSRGRSRASSTSPTSPTTSGRSWPRSCSSSASDATRARARRGAFAVTAAWAAVAGAADLATGGNYMYLRAKPVHSSLLSVMARWPWYILETAVVALAMLLALQALTDVIRRRDLGQ